MRPLRFLLAFGLVALLWSPAQAQRIGDLGNLPVTGATALVDYPFFGVSFQSPLGLRDPGDGFFYVPEYDGRIRVFEARDNVSESEIFLDISDRILGSTQRGEFYTLEFHPDYATNGYVYVTYLLGGDTGADYVCYLSRFTRSSTNPRRLDPNSEQILIELPQPSFAHSINDLAFGPDGYLYVSVGDGGEFEDPDNNAQNPGNIFGTILRLDVDNPSGGQAYGIPADNPFVGNTNGWREEIYAYGFRNPWRLSFDRLTGELYSADVGEITWEEVNRIEAGGNYGWKRLEGAFCFPLDGPQDCDRSDVVEPVLYYNHAEFGASITGGYVYRGSRVPELQGFYIFGDFAFFTAWAVDLSNPSNPNGLITIEGGVGNVSSLGQDRNGELYFSNFFGGVTRLASASGVNAEESVVADESLFRVSPNPMQQRGAFELRSDEAGTVTIRVYDSLGRLVATPFEGVVNPGTLYVPTFNTADLPAGIYIARLDLPARSVTQTFTVVR
ncbi:MAG: PQQ-dependent sugar dehydrogenase [Bacteroidota bacterium]